jgi:hypothetical protein
VRRALPFYDLAVRCSSSPQCSRGHCGGKKAGGRAKSPERIRIPASHFFPAFFFPPDGKSTGGASGAVRREGRGAIDRARHVSFLPRLTHVAYTWKKIGMPCRRRGWWRNGRAKASSPLSPLTSRTGAKRRGKFKGRAESCGGERRRQGWRREVGMRDSPLGRSLGWE